MNKNHETVMIIISTTSGSGSTECDMITMSPFLVRVGAVGGRGDERPERRPGGRQSAPRHFHLRRSPFELFVSGSLRRGVACLRAQPRGAPVSQEAHQFVQRKKSPWWRGQAF